MPLLTNGGGLLLVLVLVIVAFAGLALIGRYVTQPKCAACGDPVGDRPRFWVLTSPDGEALKAPDPRCRDCVAAGR